MIMLPVLQFLAVFSAAIFAGAALYINLIEHPARMARDTQSAAQQWAPSYHRATYMQAPLALLSLVTGIGAWLLGAGLWWLIAALAIGAVIPYTLIVVARTNRQLLTPGRDLASGETRALLDQWNRLHAVRTVLSLCATVVYLWQLLR